MLRVPLINQMIGQMNLFTKVRESADTQHVCVSAFLVNKLNEKFGWCADTHGICESATFDVVVAILLRNLLHWSLLSYIQTCSRHIGMQTR